MGRIADTKTHTPAKWYDTLIAWLIGGGLIVANIAGYDRADVQMVFDTIQDGLDERAEKRKRGEA